MPKIRPIAAQAANATANGTQVIRLLAMPAAPNAAAMAVPVAPPRAPPPSATNNDSRRNCREMSDARAPMARRRPISRDRCETDASIRFMITRPPATSATKEMASSNPSSKLPALGLEPAIRYWPTLIENPVEFLRLGLCDAAWLEEHGDDGARLAGDKAAIEQTLGELFVTDVAGVLGEHGF